MAKRILTGCRDCRLCSESGIGSATRKTAKVTAGIATAGFSSLMLAGRRKCGQCGHPASGHSDK
jgi:hypothetical protein